MICCYGRTIDTEKDDDNEDDDDDDDGDSGDADEDASDSDIEPDSDSEPAVKRRRTVSLSSVCRVQFFLIYCGSQNWKSFAYIMFKLSRAVYVTQG